MNYSKQFLLIFVTMSCIAKACDIETLQRTGHCFQHPAINDVAQNIIYIAEQLKATQLENGDYIYQGKKYTANQLWQEWENLHKMLVLFSPLQDHKPIPQRMPRSQFHEIFHNQTPRAPTNLIEAADQNNIEDFNKFMKAKPSFNVNAKDETGSSALSYAAANGNLKMVNKLLKRKADVNTTDMDGMTPLIWAASINSLPIVKALLKHHPNVNAKNNLNETALSILRFTISSDSYPTAQKQEIEAIITALEKAGAR